MTLLDQVCGCDEAFNYFFGALGVNAALQVGLAIAIFWPLDPDHSPDVIASRSRWLR